MKDYAFVIGESKEELKISELNKKWMQWKKLKLKN
jgi:hypothetical protein